jgi:hypothetical protein
MNEPHPLVPWTVLPMWPAFLKKITRAGEPHPRVIKPAPADVVIVCEPTDVEAFATLAATFGAPEVLAWREEHAPHWQCPRQTPATILAHLRDAHRTLDLGTNHIRTGVGAEALNVHWQLHQQALVHPLPAPHVHV